MDNSEEDSDLRVYLTKQAIPWYQRDGIWGLAALLILFCGLGVGWLSQSQGMEKPPQHIATLPPNPDSTTLLAYQETANQSLRDQIARLEAALQSDICRIDSGALTDEVTTAPLK
jgi:hypothetical protein